MWPFKRKPSVIPPTGPSDDGGPVLFSTHDFPSRVVRAARRLDYAMKLERALPVPDAAAGVAMDSEGQATLTKMARFGFEGLPEALTDWFMSQGFIGYQMCAMVAQQWLINKACRVPARDAIRHGFDVQVEGAADEAAGAEVQKRITKLNKKYRLNRNMEQFVAMGRVFGIRVVLFRVKSVDPLYYEKPFNPDGITPGSYLGMSQVDPYWMSPELDAAAVMDPTNPDFYEPTWWVIQGKRYHRSHLCIFRPNEVPDILKPTYNYGGVSVPQQIMERVYAAERTANEGPMLAMTKRSMVWSTDVAALLANREKAAQHMATWMEMRDNYGVKINDTNDKMEQFETTLNDLDATIMTQYQLVASAANMPATKLLGTAPKGFNSTGEYDESVYHEELETIQQNDLTPLVDRHHLFLVRSELPGFFPLLDVTALEIEIDWAPVDSPTAVEYATINKTKAETDQIYAGIGAIDGEDVRNRLQADPNSEYTNLPDVAPEGTLPPSAEKLLEELAGGPTPAPAPIEAA